MLCGKGKTLSAQATNGQSQADDDNGHHCLVHCAYAWRVNHTQLHDRIFLIYNKDRQNYEKLFK
ncbi:MAG: hypothetical protein AUI60_04470 [Thaumarchaeota archaeon 13_1_40CM_2_39_4]|nr:MAG: hypothetical protein AUI60_04470 [Thaumarchaeota archaeon 13_1_40CM_2_39_4]